MPCNAIATANARVNLEVPETVANLLSLEDARTVLIAQLTAMELSPSWYPTNPGRVLIKAGQFTIVWSKSGLSVDGPWYEQDEVDQLGATLIETLRQAAGYILQEQVTQYLQGIAHVESVEQASNGARVVTIEF